MKKAILAFISILLICFTIISAINLNRISQEKKTSIISLNSTCVELDKKVQRYSATQTILADQKASITDLENKYALSEQEDSLLAGKFAQSNRNPQIAELVKKAEFQRNSLRDTLALSRQDVLNKQQEAQSLAAGISQTEQEKRDFELELEKIKAENQRAFLTFLASLLGSLISAGATIAVAVHGNK